MHIYPYIAFVYSDMTMRSRNMPKHMHLRCVKLCFPSIGVGCPAEGIASIMHEAMTNFVKRNVVKHLQEVRIIVFQSDIINSFIGAMKDAIEGIGES